MKSVFRRAITANQFMAKRQMPSLLAINNYRGFAVARYHFDDNDYKPTITQVSFYKSTVLMA